MSKLAMLLFPFAAVYGFVMRIRNYVYNRNYKQSYRFNVPVISVGNLSIGGTGKTPAVEYLIRLLREQHTLAVLSRGYGRTTKGFRIASEFDNALTLGDEPYQLHSKYRSVKVAVGENRVSSLRCLFKTYTDISIVLLDDAFQHRRVKPRLSILLTSFDTPFFSDFVLPMGRLRESRHGASRANCVVVTKCPHDLSEKKKIAVKHRIIRYAGNKPIFFSYITYGLPRFFCGREERVMSTHVVLLSGIAQPDLFKHYVANHFDVLRHFKYADHHIYSLDEMRNVVRYIATYAHNKVALLTTEKDMVRLKDTKFNPVFSSISCYYLPMEMVLKEDKTDFDNLIIHAIQKTVS